MEDKTVDRIDLKLLRFLQKNGRASNLELAQAVNLSPAQTNRRHKRLEALGLIAAYEARLNAPALGLHVVAFIHIAMEKGHVRELPKFRESVAQFAEVQECYSVTGDFDYVLKIVAKDLKALSTFLMDKLMHHKGVSSVRSSVCLDELKCTSALPL